MNGGIIIDRGVPMLAYLKVGRYQILLWLGPKRLIKSARFQVHGLGGKR